MPASVCLETHIIMSIICMYHSTIAVFDSQHRILSFHKKREQEKEVFMLSKSVQCVLSWRTKKHNRLGGIPLLPLIALVLFPAMVTPADKPEDELDARLNWTIRWEEEVGQGKIQEKGHCTIQMSG